MSQQSQPGPNWQGYQSPRVSPSRPWPRVDPTPPPSHISDSWSEEEDSYDEVPTPLRYAPRPPRKKKGKLAKPVMSYQERYMTFSDGSFGTVHTGAQPRPDPSLRPGEARYMNPGVSRKPSATAVHEDSGPGNQQAPQTPTPTDPGNQVARPKNPNPSPEGGRAGPPPQQQPQQRPQQQKPVMPEQLSQLFEGQDNKIKELQKQLKELKDIQEAAAEQEEREAEEAKEEAFNNTMEENKNLKEKIKKMELAEQAERTKAAAREAERLGILDRVTKTREAIHFIPYEPEAPPSNQIFCTLHLG